MTKASPPSNNSRITYTGSERELRVIGRPREVAGMVEKVKRRETDKREQATFLKCK